MRRHPASGCRPRCRLRKAHPRTAPGFDRLSLTRSLQGFGCAAVPAPPDHAPDTLVWSGGVGSAGHARSRREGSRPAGRDHSLLPLGSGRCGMRLKNEAAVAGSADDATPRVQALRAKRGLRQAARVRA